MYWNAIYFPVIPFTDHSLSLQVHVALNSKLYPLRLHPGSLPCSFKCSLLVPWRNSYVGGAQIEWKEQPPPPSEYCLCLTAAYSVQSKAGAMLRKCWASTKTTFSIQSKMLASFLGDNVTLPTHCLACFLQVLLLHHPVSVQLYFGLPKTRSFVSV